MGHTAKMLFKSGLIAAAAATPFTLGHHEGIGFAGREGTGSYCIGCSDAVLGQFPHQVSLQTSSHFCGGSVLSANLIINDFAVAEMASPFTLNENCKPIPLVAPSATRPAEGHPLMTSGYGYYEYESNGRPNRVVSRYLKYSDMEYVSVATCKSIWTGQTIDNSVICADKANTSICSGDSGGPLTIEEDGETRLIGLTSWAHVYCNSNGLPQGWANVQYPEYNEWMRTNANL